MVMWLPTHTRTVSAVRYLGAELEGVIVSEAVDICRDGPNPTFEAEVCAALRAPEPGALSPCRILKWLASAERDTFLAFCEPKQSL